MAKKVETISLIDTFSEFKELKNIDRTTMVSVLEESFRSVIAKMFGTDENYDVIVNPDKGDFEIWRNREVVADEDLENPNLQIALSEAQKIDASYEVGEEVTDEVIFANFGRRAILNLRQTLASKILELEKDSIYNKYIDKVGNIINAEVYQIWKKEMLLLDDEGNELLLPRRNRFRAISIAREKRRVPWWPVWTTRITIRRLSFPVHRLYSCSVCSRWKCPKSMTD